MENPMTKGFHLKMEAFLVLRPFREPSAIFSYVDLNEKMTCPALFFVFLNVSKQGRRNR
jgi:hypothetical protein